ncbi:cytochrome P450 monooxygenase [Penicillium soppii]|uniref:cytochrome P450 monooxygenase n=1 Tax=Penicillium soppii TaxID=69789 RepID=UPI002549ABC4|nr:cytochrome P450 monooxygenase [Penicillium soppii]KAJ5865282.1 cytochrome P450 monooxygenase [Penicillium soppii]
MGNLETVDGANILVLIFEGSIVRLGPSEISFATISAFNTIYGPLSDRNTTKSGSLQGLFISLVTEITQPMISQFNKQNHKEARTDLRPIFDEMVRGPQESVHNEIFNKHPIHLPSLTGEEVSFNLSFYLDALLWDLAGGVVLGHELPERAKGIHVSGSTSHFIDATKDNAWEPESALSNFKDRLTSGTITELRLTPSEVKANIVMLAGAGYETSKTTVNNAFYFLLRDSAAFRAVREELKSNFQTRGEISDHKLISLPYLNACINESLRMMPPVNGKVMQRVSCGTTIDGVYVPKGVAVSADNFSMHRSPLYWENPESFRPERWINKQSTDNFRAFRAFSSGPRACPGRLMALQTARLTLAKIIWLYDLEMINDPIEWEQTVKSGFVWTLPDLYVRVTSSGLI